MVAVLRTGKEDCNHLYDELGNFQAPDIFLTCVNCQRKIYLTQGQDYTSFIEQNRDLIHPDKLKTYDYATEFLKKGKLLSELLK